MTDNCNKEESLYSIECLKNKIKQLKDAVTDFIKTETIFAKNLS